MEDKDLNIDSYNFDELLNLFELDNELNNDVIENIKKMSDILDIIKSKKKDFYNFYYQAFKLISTIYDFLNDGTINEMSQINEYINYIKKIKFFEKKTTIEIKYIINKQYKNEYNNYQRIVESDSSIYDSYEDDSITNIKRPNIINQLKTNEVDNVVINSISPGNLNIIQRLTYFLNLNLDSCFRINYYNTKSSDFQYTIPSEIKNVVSMRLASIEMPNSWYLFSSKKNNNFFIIDIKSYSTNAILQTSVITIPDGNYDNTMLENYLNTNYFYQAIPSDPYLKYIKCSIDPYNFKFKFESINNGSLLVSDFFYIDITFYILPLPPNNSSNDCKPSKHKQYINSSKYTHNLATLNANCVTTSNIFKCMMTNTMGWILGFRQDKYENLLINNISGSLLLSESLFDGGGDRYIYLSIDDYQNSKNILNIGCLDNFIIEKNIIAKIPMVNGKLSLVINDNEAPLTKIRKYNGPVNIKTLNIKLIDKFGDIIDLNCLDYSFTLELEILYEGFNFSNINK